MSDNFGPGLDLFVANKSSTITAGGTAQDAAAANSNRAWLLVQNPATETEPLYVDFGADAAVDGTDLTLAPGAAVVLDIHCPTGRISVNAATTGHKFIVKEG